MRKGESHVAAIVAVLRKRVFLVDVLEWYPNVETPLKDKGPEHVDFVVVRENTGGIYTGIGGSIGLSSAIFPSPNRICKCPIIDLTSTTSTYTVELSL
jgi:isocitrate/isopropylmalate dehydrogenase